MAEDEDENLDGYHITSFPMSLRDSAHSPLQREGREQGKNEEGSSKVDKSQTDRFSKLRNKVDGERSVLDEKFDSYYYHYSEKKSAPTKRNFLMSFCDVSCQFPFQCFSALSSVFHCEFFFQYFIRYPILNLLCCCSSIERVRAAFKLALGIWCLIGLVITYGIFQALRGYGFDTSANLTESIFLIIARASGKLVIFFLLLGIVIVLRPVTSTLNEVPHQLLGFSWRRLHVDFFHLSMIFAIVHTIAHAFRIYYHTATPAYEIYFLATGIVLWTLFGAQALPYFLLRAADNFPFLKCWNKILKWWFRRSHILVWGLIAIAFPIHASGSMVTVGLFAMWYLMKDKSSLRIKNAWYGQEYRQDGYYLTIEVEVETLVPDEFGYYCQIELIDLSAPYTMIPVNVSDDASTSSSTTSRMLFRIKKCALSERFLSALKDRQENSPYQFTHRNNKQVQLSLKEREDEIQQKEVEGKDVLSSSESIEANVKSSRASFNGGDGMWSFRPDDFALHIFGPFHSTDNSIKDRANKHMIILTGGSGISVAESVMQFSMNRPSYWKTVVVMQNFGRKAKWADTASREANRLANCKSDVKEVSNHEDMLNVIRPNPLPSDQNVWLAIQMYGEIDKNLLRHILEIDTISPDGNNKTHFLVCSSTWATKIKELHAVYPLDGEIWTRIHTEEFQI